MVLLILLLSSLTVGVMTLTASATAQEANSSTAVTEDAYIQEAPEPGDEYFEAEASDGRWVSYVNPRDEYRDPYLGDGSGKICTVLLNEAGEPIVGDTVSETTVTIPTGETIAWHTSADPMTVEYPLTEQYDRPLDADQFGTADDIGQGDGYMDSHCIEFHGPDTDATIEYGEASVDGEHADRIEVVGYIQNGGDTWETDIDPVEAATSYEEAGGGWTYTEDASHGQVVVVLQLASDEQDDDSETEQTVDGESGDTETNSTTNDSNSTSTDSDSTPNDSNGSTEQPTASEETPGFGVVGTIVALVAVVVVARLRNER